MAAREIILPTGTVHERLGITQAPTVPVPVKGRVINIRTLNIRDESPAKGVWVDRDAVLAWMRAKSEEAGGSAILEKMIDELAEVTL